MLAPLIIVIYLSILKHQLIKLLALLLLWTSQMLIQMIDMSNFGNTLMIYSLEVSVILLKIWFCLIISSMSLDVSQSWEFPWEKYKMPIIFRYDLDYRSSLTSTCKVLILSAFLTYCLMICKSNCKETLLVTTIIPKGSDQMKSMKISDFVFLRDLFMLATWMEEFFMNFMLFLLLMVITTCFFDSSFVIIWIWGFAFVLPLTMLLICSILLVLIVRNASLILMTSDVLIFYFEAWAYNFWGYLALLASLMFLKYLEIWLISFWDLARMGEGILSIFAGVGLLMILFLLVVGWIFGVNFAAIFFLRELDCLSA